MPVLGNPCHVLYSCRSVMRARLHRSHGIIVGASQELQHCCDELLVLASSCQRLLSLLAGIIGIPPSLQVLLPYLKSKLDRLYSVHRRVDGVLGLTSARAQPEAARHEVRQTAQGSAAVSCPSQASAPPVDLCHTNV